MTSRFQSTHPARGATPYWCVLARPAFHFNPRTPRGVRQVADGPPGDCVIISIHAPREGCDKAPLAGGTKERNFNPRTPRGVRLFGVLTKNRSLDFNPRTPRGVRRGGMSAPMRGGDFNPRTPRGVRRSVMRSSICSNSISIHAPREGCDERPCCTSETGRHYFNPRTPRGVRHLLAEGQSAILEFQSTHPARGATRWCCWWRSSAPQFQSTHPARGATAPPLLSVSARGHFNPRTPRGVRQYAGADLEAIEKISIHAPREGCDLTPSPRSRPKTNFNPRTPRGVRQQTLPKSREFAWLNLLICTRGRRLSIQKQTRLCSIKLSFMLFGCEPAGEGVSSWTSHATKSKVRLEGRSAYSQSARSSAHSDFPGNKSGDCPVRGP